MRRFLPRLVVSAWSLSLVVMGGGLVGQLCYDIGRYIARGNPRPTGGKDRIGTALYAGFDMFFETIGLVRKDTRFKFAEAIAVAKVIFDDRLYSRAASVSILSLACPVAKCDYLKFEGASNVSYFVAGFDFLGFYH